MLRRTPLKTKTPLRSKTPLARGKRLKPIGKTKAKEIAETSDWRREWLAEHPRCEVGPILDKAGVVNYCWGSATGIHEKFKRSAGGNQHLMTPGNLLAACSPCNSQIEDQPVMARELGLSVRSINEIDEDDSPDLGPSFYRKGK